MTPSVAEPQTIVAGGITTGYLEAGSSEPLLTLHGSGPGVSATANWHERADEFSTLVANYLEHS